MAVRKSKSDDKAIVAEACGCEVGEIYDIADQGTRWGVVTVDGRKLYGDKPGGRGAAKDVAK